MTPIACQDGIPRLRATNGTPMRVIALSRKLDSATDDTFRLRVDQFRPLLKERGVVVDAAAIPRSGREKRRLFSTLGDYDVAWLHRHTMWRSDIDQLAKQVSAIVFDYDDAICHSPTNRFGWSIARALKFRSTLRRCSLVFAATERLVELARPHVRDVRLMRLAIDPARFTNTVRPRDPEEPLRVLWLGGKKTFAFLARIAPALSDLGRLGGRVQLVVVGHSPLSVKGLSIENLRWSPEVEARELTRCHVGLAPLPSTPFARGKATMKPLQYMASGMPFLGEPVGHSVALAGDGARGILIHSPRDWARAIESLADDERRRQAMGQAAVHYFLSHHTPHVLLDQIESALRSLPNGRSRLAA